MPLRFSLAVLLLAVTLAPAWSTAADLGDGPAPLPGVTDETAVEGFLARRAVLYEIRRSFDVLTDDEAANALRADAVEALSVGVAPEAAAETEDELVGEASYFIVSMKYLVTSGFPAWPEDRSESTYAKDSTAILAPLLGELRRAIDVGDDASDVLQSAARVFWWAEGKTEPEPSKADFAGIDAKVADVIAEVKSDSKSSA